MTVDDPDAAAQPARGAFRHLPEGVALRDTVTSARGDTAPEPGGEPNEFIAAALEAGG